MRLPPTGEHPEKYVENSCKHLEFRSGSRHTCGVGTMIRKIRERRRERRLARELELRYRDQLDQRAVAAVQMTDELRHD